MVDIVQILASQSNYQMARKYWNKLPDEFAILTNIIHQEWAGINVSDHKKMKGLKSQNLCDHMSEAELIFTALAELSTRQIAETMQAEGMPENKIASKVGGIAKDARLKLEKKIAKKIVTADSYLERRTLKIDDSK